MFWLGFFSSKNTHFQSFMTIPPAITREDTAQFYNNVSDLISNVRDRVLTIEISMKRNITSQWNHTCYKTKVWRDQNMVTRSHESKKNRRMQCKKKGKQRIEQRENHGNQHKTGLSLFWTVTIVKIWLRKIYQFISHCEKR